MTESMIK